MSEHISFEIVQLKVVWVCLLCCVYKVAHTLLIMLYYICIDVNEQSLKKKRTTADNKDNKGK